MRIRAWGISVTEYLGLDLDLPHLACAYIGLGVVVLLRTKRRRVLINFCPLPVFCAVRKRADSLVVREVSDGILVLDMEGAQIHQLNATAAFIWRHCDGVAGAADIATSLAREYELEAVAAERDVETALSELKALNLVVEG